MKKVILCILDGVGIREEINGNCIKLANMNNLNKFISCFPNSLLDASGLSVGLPAGQMGNSEVGHTNIGCGRVVYQPLQIINNSFSNCEFENNIEFKKIINHVKDNNSKLHICGLLSDGGVHSHIDHLFKIVDILKNSDIDKIYYHLFLDGRDTKVNSGIDFLKDFTDKINEEKIGKIATISGRFYAMDRDNRYERIKLSYDAIVNGCGNINKDIFSQIKNSYDRGIFDEFIEPFIVDEEGMIDSNDGVIVFNFRPDRLRELFYAITNKDFIEFSVKNLTNIKLTTMFPVSSDVICTNMFEHDNNMNTFGKLLEINKKKQLRISETEKYAHVTYFFDGGKSINMNGKDEILIPSPRVKTYDLKPEMSAREITEELIINIDKNIYDFILVNYANGDMLGHTGNINATIEGLEVVDECIGKLYETAFKNDYLLIITADHGNSDYMIDEKNEIVTSHSTSLVPLIVLDKNYTCQNGKLADIAPSILKIMNLDIPEEMTGNIIIR